MGGRRPNWEEKARFACGGGIGAMGSACGGGIGGFGEQQWNRRAMGVFVYRQDIEGHGCAPTGLRGWSSGRRDGSDAGILRYVNGDRSGFFFIGFNNLKTKQ